MNFVLAVCDNAAKESCPVWPGQPMTAYWGIPDPAAAEGTKAEKHLAFAEAYRTLHGQARSISSYAPPTEKTDFGRARFCGHLTQPRRPMEIILTQAQCTPPCQSRRSWANIETIANHGGIVMTMTRFPFRNRLPSQATFSARRPWLQTLSTPR